jgi:hypothetical protein
VKVWIKAVGIACLVELLFVMGLVTMHLADAKTLNPRILTFLSLYHMFAISLTYTVLNIIWAWPGPGREHIRTSNTLMYLLVYLFQVVITTPIFYGLLRWIGYVRREKIRTNTD